MIKAIIRCFAVLLADCLVAGMIWLVVQSTSTNPAARQAPASAACRKVQVRLFCVLIREGISADF